MSNNTSDQLSLQSQRLGVISDRTLRTENKLDQITRDLGTIKAILRSIEKGLDNER